MLFLALSPRTYGELVDNNIFIAELLSELDMGEKQANVSPKPEVDLFMKVATRDHKINIYKFHSIMIFHNI